MSYKTIQLSKTADIIIGFPFASEKFNINAQGIRLVRGKNITTGNLRWGDDTRWWDDSSIDLSKYMLKADDIVIGMDGSLVGKNYAKISENDLPLLLVQRVACIRAKEGYDQRFLWGCIASGKFERYIDSIKTGTSIPHISGGQIGNYLIPDFDLPTQKKIAAILSALDEKIAINRAINENLERQISEIYRVWYQKYVCAVGLPLVESEYGLIPQGWHYSLVGELCKSISISHKFDAEKLIFLNTGDIEDGRFLHANYMAVSDMPGQAKKTILPGDILYSEIRPINKHYAYVTFPSEDYVVSTKLMVIRASGIDSRRLYHYLTTEDVITKLQMEAESRSGTFPQIRFDNISKLPILIADDVTEAAFTTLLHTVYDQIEYNNSENEKLASLRDSLLPRLISGEIDVSAV